MQDTHTLLFMGVETAEPETFRARIYSATEDPEEARRRAFVAQLAAEGVIDCPAIDAWTAALRERGWLPDWPDIEPHPDGSGRKVGRWRLTAKGRAAWAEMSGP
ncbi:MAG: hypothetical protein VW516_09560 [Rhodospirillaceae bacterium]|jgi:hypothetical protein